MPALPWKALEEPQPEREYLVIRTSLPLRRATKLPMFVGYVNKIRKQLDGTEGLIGYSLLAKPISSNYWTLSAWDGEDALGRFVQQSPHREAMRDLARVLSGFRTVRWTAPGDSLPPSWSEALARD